MLTMGALRSTLDTTEEQDYIASDLRKHAEEALASSVLIEFEVIADTEQAHAVFLEKASVLMDLLQMSTNPQQRWYLDALVREAYAVRNLVVHEGQSEHAFARQDKFRFAVREFIRIGISLCDHLKTPQDLIRRVGELRFS
jgi:hypothetical protein